MKNVIQITAEQFELLDAALKQQRKEYRSSEHKSFCAKDHVSAEILNRYIEKLDALIVELEMINPRETPWLGLQAMYDPARQPTPDL